MSRRDQHRADLFFESLTSAEQFNEEAPTESDPYPNIRADVPYLYQAALNAESKVEKLRWFRDTYYLLANAVSEAHLELDPSDQVIVIPGEESVEKLLGQKLIQQVLKSSGKRLVKQLIGPDFATALGLLDLLHKVKTALEREENRRLVSEQNRSKYETAYKYKLHFFIRLYISQTAPHAHQGRETARLTNLFWTYRDAWNTREIFRTFEKDLPYLSQGLPRPSRPPVMRSR